MQGKRLIGHISAVLWMIAIFMLSNEPAAESSIRSGRIIELLASSDISRSDGISTLLVRKSAHIFMYFVLGMLLFNVLKDYILGNKKLIGFSILFAGLYAITDEIHQTFVSGRSAEVRDVLLDTIGATLGVILCWAILSIMNKRKLVKNAKG